MNQLLQDDQEVLLPDTPPPPYPHDNSNKSLQARPTFWSPRQPPNRDWKTMAVRGKQFVHSLRCPPTVFSVAGTVQEAPPPAYESRSIAAIQNALPFHAPDQVSFREDAYQARSGEASHSPTNKCVIM